MEYEYEKMEDKLKNKKAPPLGEYRQGKGWRRWVPRLLAGVVGLILLIAALSKASDMLLFVRQMREYGIVSNHLILGIGAWALILLESSLGVALLLSYRPKLTLSLTLFLFLFFVGVAGWAWFSGATQDCGCFGSFLKRTPGEAVLEGLILIVVTAVALMCRPSGTSTQRGSKFWAIVAACLIGLALPIFSSPELLWLKKPSTRLNDTPLGHIKIEGQDPIDLMRGSYLIVLLDTDCVHCLETLPELNSLAQADDLPMVIGLCVNEKEKRRNFVKEFQPEFPLEPINDDVFWRLLGDGDLPRIILLRNGRIQGMWDKIAPSQEAVRAAQA